MTSAIYVPYTFFVAVGRLAEHGLDRLEVIGTPTSRVWPLPQPCSAVRPGDQLHVAGDCRVLRLRSSGKLMTSNEAEYQRRWKAAGSVEDFGAWLLDAWSDRYLSAVPAAASDLVVTDPGNGFQYLFDLAGLLGHEPAAWAPRARCMGTVQGRADS